MKLLQKNVTVLCLMVMGAIVFAMPVQETASVYAEIIDHAGRTVVLEEKAERIVSGYYMTTSMLIGLGLEDNIVGIENKAKSRSIYALAASHLLDLPGVGTSKDFDLELCISLQPDLVILPLRLKDVANSLGEFGIPTLCVNPETTELLAETIQMIALATGTTERGAEILASSQKALEHLAEKLPQGNKPTVYLASNSNFLSTAGKKMYQSSLIETAGGKNVAYQLEDAYWATISYEQVIQYNPDYIIVTPAATFSVEDVLDDTAISSLKAVQNQNVYKMPNSLESWDAPIPASYLGVLWLSSVLYPEYYSKEDFIAETVEFYKKFYGVEVDTTLLY